MMALFVTVRRRNHFAAVHDLLSGTRVVTRASALFRPRLSLQVESPPLLGPERIGPYAVVRREGDWTFAWDEILRRPVWVRRLPAGTPPISAPRRDLTRPTRLRWLNGHRSENENWDAYEAPAGAPLTARLNHRQPWSHLRFWVHDLADEISAARAEGTLPSFAGPDHVWITSNGRGVLIEFTAPGAIPAATFDLNSAAQVQQFLSDIISSGVKMPLPLHAQQFADALRAQRFEAAGVIAGNLRSLLNRPAQISRSRRALTLALPAIVALLGSLSAVPIGLHSGRSFDAMWHREHPQLPSPRAALDLHAADSLDAQTLEHLAVHLGGHYGDVFKDSEFWQRPVAIEITWGSTRRFAERAAHKYAQVSADRLKAADIALNDLLIRSARHQRFALLWMPPLFFIILLAPLQLIAVLPAPWLKAPLGLRWFGTAIVRKDGAPASKIRIALRCAIAIVPALCGLLAASQLVTEPFMTTAWIIMLACGLILFVSAAWSILEPHRGPADVLAGTCLTMR
jgi:hypothetical protein